MSAPKRPADDDRVADSHELTTNRLEPSHDDGINLLDALIVIAKHKLLIFAVTASAAVLSAIYALYLPNVYTSTARILPPQQGQSLAASMLGQLGSAVGMPVTAMGIKNPTDMYVGMLKSRTIADNLIERFELQALYGAESMAATRAALAGNTAITHGRDGLITIEFKDEKPARAADVANAYVDELDKLTQSLALTEASQRRLFFERQLARAKNDLIKAELAAREALERDGVAMVGEQSKSLVESISRLRAQITAKEVQISAMRGFASDQNPELLRARQELAALHAQLGRLEGTDRRDIASATGRGSAQGLRNVGLLREVKYNEVLFELLVKQYELAKIEEAKDAGIVQVVDAAVAPDSKSNPRRARIVITATFVALFFALLLAFLREARERARLDPSKAARLAALSHYASLRRS